VPRFDAAEQPAASASDEQRCHAAKYKLGYQKNAYAGQRGATLANLVTRRKRRDEGELPV